MARRLAAKASGSAPRSSWMVSGSSPKARLRRCRRPAKARCCARRCAAARPLRPAAWCLAAGACRRIRWPSSRRAPAWCGTAGHHRCARARQVDGVVFHHRARGAVRACELGVGQLRFGVGARGAEVVAQAQRVADLVHHRVLHVVLHELLRHRAIGVESPRALPSRPARSQLLGRQAPCRQRRWLRASAGGRLAVPRQRRRKGKGGRRWTLRGSTWLRSVRMSRAGMPSKATSASRISPLRGSTCAGADGAKNGAGVHHPAHRGVAEVQRVELGVVGCCCTTMAPRKPIFSKALFHSRIARAPFRGRPAARCGRSRR
jgi:hypothetical protein